MLAVSMTVTVVASTFCTGSENRNVTFAATEISVDPFVGFVNRTCGPVVSWVVVNVMVVGISGRPLSGSEMSAVSVAVSCWFGGRPSTRAKVAVREVGS